MAHIFMSEGGLAALEAAGKSELASFFKKISFYGARRGLRAVRVVCCDGFSR